jgi:hypothetical protein
MTRIEERHGAAAGPAPAHTADGRPAVRGGPGSLVPPGEVRSYYGRPVIKPPVWKKEIPWYLFTGGLAGASSLLAAAGRLSGRPGLARASRRVALAGALASPALLIGDLGKSERFANMLRVVRPTSPMNMGAWLLGAYGPSAGAAALLDAAGILPGAGRVADAAAAATGALLTTYTGVLLADTAVPAWHDARRELPFLFAAGAATSAGGAAAIFTAPAEAGPARRLALAGFVAEQAAMRGISRRLGPLADAYKEGPAGRYDKAATWLGLAGGLVLAGAGRRRAGAAAGGALLLASAVATRFAVFHAGSQSAEDPEATIGPQRARLAPG